MKRICVMKNPVQEYAWGSYTAIPELLGKPSPASTPQAELWMGAHPKAPSMIRCDKKWESLDVMIEKNPKDILGKAVADKFKNKLPYLFKVLAADKPLSIQAHPNLTQAKEGFAMENRLGIPWDAYKRNYKDDNHKPECICALTPFWALKGFRKIPDILSLIEKICPEELEKEIHSLRSQPNSYGLKRFFQTLMTMDRERQKQIIVDAEKNARKFKENDQAYKWMIDLHEGYPADIGVFSSILLNVICLNPGQVMFLPAGELHAYLHGVGIELMANSDNVLRGGLTPKHVDVPELLSVLNFEEQEVNILPAQKTDEVERIYFNPAEEFVLSIISVKEGSAFDSSDIRSVEILLCIEGESTVTDFGNNEKLTFSKGRSIIIPAAVKKYHLEGKAIIYKAAVPL